MAFETIRIGTRGSKLALWQADYVASHLKASGFSTQIVVINTKGDQILDRSLSKIGSKGVFTEELEQALRSGEIHLAQHSAKDLQSHLSEDLELIAFTKREQVNDVIVSFDKTFSPLDVGKKMGTSSVRRQAFFRKHYPQLQLVDMRGNLQTRIEKLRDGQAHALTLAYAGVYRMGYEDLIVHYLPATQFVPPVGQGSVAIEISSHLPREIKYQIRACLNDPDTEHCLLAERSFLQTLQGGCSIPAFCLAQIHQELLSMEAGLISTDGLTEIRFASRAKREDWAVLGNELANKVLLNGGRKILDAIHLEQSRLQGQ